MAFATMNISDLLDVEIICL